MLKSLCPICKKTLESSLKDFKNHAFFPFCSERCKLVDLQGWLSERYRFSSPLKDEKENKTETDSSDENTSS